MTRYLESLSNQRPFPVDVDENNRTRYSCNYRFHIAGSNTGAFEDEIVKLLQDNGLVTGTGMNGNTFVGRSIVLPSGDGPYIQLIDTGGLETEETHNNNRYERPTLQILVIAKSSRVARDKSLAIWRLLDGKRNFTITV